MVAAPEPTDELELEERLARIEERTDAALELLENLSARFAVVEELLERYAPMLAMAEQRMSGGLGRLKRGVPRAQNRSEGR